jgi:hypothetical protein
MSRSLTIDTSTSQTIVGLIEDGQVLFQSSHEGATDHGAAIIELVSAAIAAGGAPTQVIVGMGPGPFTGLRVGIAYARSYALARNIPLIGICSLDAIEIDQPEYTVAIDARRKEIYWARYRDGVRVEGPSVSKPDEVTGFLIGNFPTPARMVSLSTEQNFSEPFYLRRPDAVPTAER